MTNSFVMDAMQFTDDDRHFSNLFANTPKALDLLRQSGKPCLGLVELMQHRTGSPIRLKGPLSG